MQFSFFTNLIKLDTYDSPSLLITTTPTTPLWDWIRLRVSSISFVEDCYNWIDNNYLKQQSETLKYLPFLRHEKSLPLSGHFLQFVRSKLSSQYILTPSIVRIMKWWVLNLIYSTFNDQVVFHCVLITVVWFLKSISKLW